MCSVISGPSRWTDMLRARGTGSLGGAADDIAVLRR